MVIKSENEDNLHKLVAKSTLIDVIVTYVKNVWKSVECCRYLAENSFGNATFYVSATSYHHHLYHD